MAFRNVRGEADGAAAVLPPELTTSQQWGLFVQVKIFRSGRPFRPKGVPAATFDGRISTMFRGDISSDREAIRSDLPDEKRYFGGYYR